MSDMPELLPCPFCGGEMGPHDGMRWVLCVECGAESGRQIDASAAIAAWNSRATPAASPEVQAMIREAEAKVWEAAAEAAFAYMTSKDPEVRAARVQAAIEFFETEIDKPAELVRDAIRAAALRGKGE